MHKKEIVEKIDEDTLMKENTIFFRNIPFDFSEEEFT